MVSLMVRVMFRLLGFVSHIFSFAFTEVCFYCSLLTVWKMYGILRYTAESALNFTPACCRSFLKCVLPLRFFQGIWTAWFQTCVLFHFSGCTHKILYNKNSHLSVMVEIRCWQYMQCMTDGICALSATFQPQSCSHTALIFFCPSRHISASILPSKQFIDFFFRWMGLYNAVGSPFIFSV